MVEPAAPLLPPVDGVDGVLLSEPQAASDSAAVKAMPATKPDRWSFTIFLPMVYKGRCLTGTPET